MCEILIKYLAYQVFTTSNWKHIEMEEEKTIKSCYNFATQFILNDNTHSKLHIHTDTSPFICAVSNSAATAAAAVDLILVRGIVHLDGVL